MEEFELDEDARRIPRLYLEKLELLNQREREVLLKTIDILNHPIFITPNKK